MRSLSFLVLVSCVLLVSPASLVAQLEGGGSLPPSVASLTPPSVLEAAEATYPPDALAQGLTATVELVVTIAIDGTVTDAQVPSPVGNGFDEAAVEALRRFRFTPAMRDGTPIVARIRYRYVFAPPAPPPEPEPVEAAAPTTGRIVGEVHAEADDALVAGATITLTDRTSGTVRTITADADGHFVVDELPPGAYRLDLAAEGLATVSYEETVVAGEETSVLYRLPAAATSAEADPEGPSYSARATIDPPPRELTRRTIEREALYRIPGTGGDALRAIEILPGVGRPPFGIGFVLIRGAGPNDSLVTLDGVPIPALYHFGGIRSVYNSRLLDRNVLYPGNFSSRYGRASGGVIEIETRDPAQDRVHGIVEVGGFDSSVLLEAPITKKFAIAGAFRRSLVDLYLPALLGSSVGFTAAPSYYDYQLMGVWRPTSRDRVKFQFYGSSDRFAVFGKGGSEANASAADNAASLTTRFNLFQANWNHSYRGNTDQSVVFQVGPAHQEFNAGTFFRLSIGAVQMYGRSEWLTRLSPHLRLVTGLDVNAAPYNATYIGPPAGQEDGNPGNSSGQQVGVAAKGFYVRPAAYADLAIEQGPLLVNVALRADYYSDITAYSIDPRLLARYTIRPEWTIKAAAGLYSQPAAFQYSDSHIGNPNLGPIHTAHLGAGVDYAPFEGMRFGVEGFYKPIWDNVVAGQTSTDAVYTNAGIGRIYGMEISAAIQPIASRKYFAYLSYTLLRSERRDHADQPWRSYDYDQTHMLNAVFSYFLPRGWEVGAAVRYFTGNPYAPVASRVWNATQASYQPIVGAINSLRNPSYNRVDLRVQKTWQMQAWKLCFFVDIQNLLNHKNQEAVFYNYDFTLRGPVHGVPIFPAVGLRAEF